MASATFPPQTDHILVDLFSSMTAGGALLDKAPPHLTIPTQISCPHSHPPWVQKGHKPCKGKFFPICN